MPGSCREPFLASLPFRGPRGSCWGALGGLPRGQNEHVVGLQLLFFQKGPSTHATATYLLTTVENEKALHSPLWVLWTLRDLEWLKLKNVYIVATVGDFVMLLL